MPAVGGGGGLCCVTESMFLPFYLLVLRFVYICRFVYFHIGISISVYRYFNIISIKCNGISKPCKLAAGEF